MSTKAKPKNQPTSETALTVKGSGGELVTYDYGEHAGSGWEDVSNADFQIPFLAQLQGLSDQIDEGSDTYVEGAKSGHFLNTATNALYTEGVTIVPILRQHRFVEWVPRKQGGGLVGVHAPDSDVVAQAIEAAKGSLDLKTEAGNDLIETFYVYACVLPEDGELDPSNVVVLPFTKTKIKRYRAFMTTLRTAFKGCDKVPMFAHRLRMTSTREKNKSGETYYNMQLRPLTNGDVQASMIPSSETEFLTAMAGIADMVHSGAATIDYDKAENESTAGGESAGTGEKPY